MRVFVVVNRIEEIGFRQTTALLVAALVRQGNSVWLVDVNGFSAAALAEGTEYFVRGCQLPADGNCQSEQVEAFAKSATSFSRQQVSAGDIVLVRTNPGRDIARTPVHESFLQLCIAAQEFGVRVVNAPKNLRYFASKSSLVAVEPQFRPAMVVTSELSEVVEFVDTAPGDCVAKPLIGSRGENVIRISKATKDLPALLQSTFGNTALVVQQFVDADHPGDKRVVVLAGDVLAAGGHVAGIERHPASDDFRANLHAGGTAHQLVLSGAAMAAAKYAAKLLHENGIWLAGVDLIGDKIIEFNVFSTGGLYDAIEFSGFRFDDLIAERLAELQNE